MPGYWQLAISLIFQVELISRELFSRVADGGYITSFLIGKDGMIRDIRIGAFQSKQEIEKSLSKIMPNY